jgi:hypothetical protein
LRINYRSAKEAAKDHWDDTKIIFQKKF